MSDPQVQLPFIGGLNENIDERHLSPGEMAQADNVSFVTDGSAERRFGFEDLTPATGMTRVERIMPMGDRIIAADGTKLWAYNSTASQNGDDFFELGAIAEATVLRTPVTTIDAGVTVTPNVTFSGYDIAYGNGMIAMACVSADDIRVEVYDASTMQLLTAPGLVMPKGGAYDPSRVKIGWLNDRLVVIFTAFNSTSMYGNFALTADISSTAANGGFQASEVTIATDVTTDPLVPLGAYFDTANDDVYIAYKDSTANDVAVIQVDSALGLLDTVSTNVDPTITDLSVAFDGNDTIMVAVALGAPSTLGLITVARAAWTVSATNYSTGCDVDGTSYRCSIVFVESGLWYAGLSVGTTDFTITEFRWRTFDDVAVAVGANALSATNVVLASGMFAYDGKAYAVVAHCPPILDAVNFYTAPSPLVMPPVGAAYVVDLDADFDSATSTLRWVATIAPHIMSPRVLHDDGTIAGTTGIPATVLVDASSFVTFVATNSVVQARINLERLDIDFKDPKRWQGAELGGMLYTEGSRYDGRRILPTGFAWAPTIASTAGAGSATIPVGTYSYYVCYERVLSDGSVERSPPSNNVQVTAPAPGLATIRLTVTTCGMCSDDPGSIVLYRTIANGEVYYRQPLTTENGEINDYANPTVVIDHALTDAELQDGSHPYIYTTGGVLASATPPTFRQIVSEDNRLYAIGDDARTIWYSKQYLGSVAPAFVLDFTFAIEDTRNLLTAIATSDGRKVFFTESEMFVMGGKGPSDSGQGSDYNEPTRLPFAIGCTNWRSVVTTEDGIWFQSKRGLELLTRGMDLAPFQDVGAKVRRTLASYPFITSATVIPGQSQVRFTCSSTDDVDTARDGRVLVWDTRFKRWSVHIYRRSQADSASCVPVAAFNHDTLGYVWVWQSASDALVKREKADTEAAPWADYTSAWCTRTIKTAWLKTQAGAAGASPTDGTQGWQRVRRVRLLAERFSAHGMTLTMGYDYAAGSDVRTFTEATVTALGAVEQLRIVPAAGKARCSAIQVTITDTAPATIGTGRGCSLTGLAFEVHPKNGGARNIGASAKG